MQREEELQQRQQETGPTTPAPTFGGQQQQPPGQPTRIEPGDESPVSDGRLPAGGATGLRIEDTKPASRVTNQPQAQPFRPAPLSPVHGSLANDPGAMGSSMVNSGATNLMPFDMVTVAGQPARLAPGIGPRLVVMITSVLGVGGGPFVKGQVINASHLLGEARLRKTGNDQMDKANGLWATSSLKRYFELKSVRYATPEEAQQDFVQLLTTPDQVASALETETVRRVTAEQQNEELRQRLAQMEAQLAGRDESATGEQGQNVDL